MFLSCLLVLIFQFFGPVESLTASPEIIQGAKNEGTFLLYTSMNIPDARVLLKGFQEKYPFIEPKIYRSRSAALLQRVINEAEARKNAMDVLQANAFTVYVLTKKGHTGRYISPEASAYPKGFRDPNGHWVTAYQQLNVIGYNTAMVPEAEAPKSYKDLLNPKWKGKMGLDDKQYIWFEGMLNAMGKEKGLQYMKSLARQQIQFRSGNTLLASLLGAGEFTVLANTRVSTLEKLIAKGAPLGWVAAKPTTVNVLPLALANNAPHPNAAKLFIDYVLSEKGQKAIASMGRTPARPGVQPTYKLPKGLELIVNDPEMAERINAIAKQYKKIFGIP